jgi:hypothetical protein
VGCCVGENIGWRMRENFDRKIVSFKVGLTIRNF